MSPLRETLASSKAALLTNPLKKSVAVRRQTRNSFCMLHIPGLNGQHAANKSTCTLAAAKIILQPVWPSNSPLAFKVEKTNSGQANHIVYRVSGRFVTVRRRDFHW